MSENNQPEKDAHGCRIGEERYDEKQEKCVPITAEAKKKFAETSKQLKEQDAELTVDDIKQKIVDLSKQREELDKKLWPAPELPVALSEEERLAIQTQIDVIYAEIQAYEQALATIIAGQAAEHAGGSTQEAEWDTEYINNLPDGAFAYVESGGEKDDQGKTTPRSLRHFPFKNAEGNLSADHVSNGLARLGQGLGDWATEDAQAQIKKKLCAAAKELEIESEVCGLTQESFMLARVESKIIDTIERAAAKEGLKDPKSLKEYQALQNELVETKKAKVTVKGQLSEAERKLAEALEREKTLRGNVVKELRSIAFERIPSYWGVGPTQMNMRLKHLISDLEGEGVDGS